MLSLITYQPMILSKAIAGFLFEFTLRYSVSTADRVYRPALNRFCAFLGDVEVDTIVYNDLIRFMRWLKVDFIPDRYDQSQHQGEALSGASLDNYWKALRSFFRWCSDNGIAKNISVDLPRPEFSDPEIQPLTEAEVVRLLEAGQYSKTLRLGKLQKFTRPTAKRNRALLLLLLDTGIRLGELHRLTIADVHLDAGEIYITAHGTGRKTKSRIIPISKSTRMAIWHYVSTLKDFDTGDRLFTLEYDSIRPLLLRLGEAAEVKNPNPHRFRHTFSIEYLRNGGDIFTLQRILGHSTLDMVKRYLAIVQADLQQAHRRASPVDRWNLG